MTIRGWSASRSTRLAVTSTSAASSAVRNSAQVCGRWARSLASARRMICSSAGGRCGRNTDGGSGVWATWAIITAKWLEPSNGHRPVMQRYSVTPIE